MEDDIKIPAPISTQSILHLKLIKKMRAGELSERESVLLQKFQNSLKESERVLGR